MKQFYICGNCGSTTNGTKITRGSFWIELVLWMAFILPGLIYSIWRLTTRKFVCPVCREPGIVPVDSPRGRNLTVEFTKADVHSNGGRP